MVEITHVERADGMTGCRWIPWLPFTHEIEAKWQSIIETLKSNDIEGHTRGGKKNKREISKMKKIERILLFRKQTYWRHGEINLFFFLNSINFCPKRSYGLFEFHMLVHSGRDPRLYILHHGISKVLKLCRTIKNWSKRKQSWKDGTKVTESLLLVCSSLHLSAIYFDKLPSLIRFCRWMKLVSVLEEVTVASGRGHV